MLSREGGRQTARPGKLFPKSQGSSPSQGLGVGRTPAGVQHPYLCAQPGRQQSIISISKLSKMLRPPLAQSPQGLNCAITVFPLSRAQAPDSKEGPAGQPPGKQMLSSSAPSWLAAQGGCILGMP